MEPGDTWIFDSWKPHRVENGSDEHRVHLVIDTSGSSKFWQTIGKSEWRCVRQVRKPATATDQFVTFDEGKSVTILTEQYNAPLVMHPGELDALIQDIVFDMRACGSNDRQAAVAFELVLQDFRCEWRRLWYLYGQSSDGWSHYEKLIKEFRMPHAKLQLASNRGSAVRTFSARVLTAALNVSLADQY
jgi:hypothetical protein